MDGMGPKSTASIAGHPALPLLMPFPIAFLVTAFMSDLAGCFQEDQARFGILRIGASAEQAARQGVVIELVVLSAQRELEAASAIEVAMADALIAAGARQDGHHLALEADGGLGACGVCRKKTQKGAKEEARMAIHGMKFSGVAGKIE